MESIWEAIRNGLAWEIFLIIGGGTLLAGVKAKAPNYAPHALYAIAGATCVAVLIFTFTGRGLTTPAPLQITGDNIEENIKVWADHLAIGIERQPPQQGVFFDYIARSSAGGNPVEVFRANEKPGYLQLKASIAISEQHQAILDKMSPADFAKVINQINVEVSRLRMRSLAMFPIDGQGRPTGIMQITFQKGIPISDLSEWYFSTQFDDVGGAIEQVRAIVNMALGTLPGTPVHAVTQSAQ